MYYLKINKNIFYIEIEIYHWGIDNRIDLLNMKKWFDGNLAFSEKCLDICCVEFQYIFTGIEGDIESINLKLRNRYYNNNEITLKRSIVTMKYTIIQYRYNTLDISYKFKCIDKISSLFEMRWEE